MIEFNFKSTPIDDKPNEFNQFWPYNKGICNVLIDKLKHTRLLYQDKGIEKVQGNFIILKLSPKD